MGAIALDDARGGMVLERDVVVAPDRMLLAAGVTLTDAHLMLLRMWGVTEVDVRGVTRSAVLEQAAAEVNAARRQVLEAEVAELFRHAGQGHPAVDELAHIVLLRRLRREAGDGRPD